jgi:hypothetical protein
VAPTSQKRGAAATLTDVTLVFLGHRRRWRRRCRGSGRSWRYRSRRWPRAGSTTTTNTTHLLRAKVVIVELSAAPRVCLVPRTVVIPWVATSGAIVAVFALNSCGWLSGGNRGLRGDGRRLGSGRLWRRRRRHGGLLRHYDAGGFCRRGQSRMAGGHVSRFWCRQGRLLGGLLGGLLGLQCGFLGHQGGFLSHQCRS